MQTTTTTTRRRWFFLHEKGSSSSVLWIAFVSQNRVFNESLRSCNATRRFKYDLLFSTSPDFVPCSLAPASLSLAPTFWQTQSRVELRQDVRDKTRRKWKEGRPSGNFCLRFLFPQSPGEFGCAAHVSIQSTNSSVYARIKSSHAARAPPTFELVQGARVHIFPFFRSNVGRFCDQKATKCADPNLIEHLHASNWAALWWWVPNEWNRAPFYPNGFKLNRAWCCGNHFNALSFSLPPSRRRPSH